MVNEELLTYIKSQLTAGVPREKITDTLVSEGGWLKDDVDKAFEVALSTSNKEEPPLSSVGEEDDTTKSRNKMTYPLFAILAVVSFVAFWFVFQGPPTGTGAVEEEGEEEALNDEAVSEVTEGLVQEKTEELSGGGSITLDSESLVFFPEDVLTQDTQVTLREFVPSDDDRRDGFESIANLIEVELPVLALSSDSENAFHIAVVSDADVGADDHIVAVAKIYLDDVHQSDLVMEYHPKDKDIVSIDRATLQVIFDEYDGGDAEILRVSVLPMSLIDEPETEEGGE